MEMSSGSSVEPWLRGTLREVPAVQRAVLHALELAREDVARWVFPLQPEELLLRPYGLPSVAFQVRHMARSLGRLLTYAEGQALSEADLEALRTEEGMPVTPEALRDEFDRTLDRARARVLAFDAAEFEQPRTVGRAGLPTSLGGLLVHCADHTQRHAGQAVTTAKVVLGLRGAEQS